MIDLVKKYWIGFVVVFFLGFAIVIVFFRPQQLQNIDDSIQALIVVLGYVLFLAQYIYGKSDRVYIWANKWRLKITNATSQWTLQGELGNPEVEHPLEKLLEVIEQSGLNWKLWHRDEFSLVVNMSGFTIRARITQGHVPFDDYDDERANNGTISLQLSDLEMPFRSLKTRLEQEIIPLFSRFVRSLHPAVEEYSAKVHLPADNPYFGYFVKRLEYPKVVSFNCTFHETNVGALSPTVAIKKERIEIVTSDLATLYALSLKYIMFAADMNPVARD